MPNQQTHILNLHIYSMIIDTEHVMYWGTSRLLIKSCKKKNSKIHLYEKVIFEQKDFHSLNKVTLLPHLNTF
jgi:hypothetical protein